MGVHPFLMARRGPNWSRLREFVPAHLEFIKRTRAEGKLAASGPIVEGRATWQGSSSSSACRTRTLARIAEEDPFVKNGVVTIEAHRWWCAAHVLPGW